MRKISTIATAPDIQVHAAVQGVPLLNGNHQDCGPEQSAPRPADSDPTQLPEPLTAKERDQLAECESRISDGLRQFVDVGRALATVHARRLYREDFRTFEQYCQLRWQFTRMHAYRLMDASTVIEVLSPFGDNLPSSEAQARPLVGLKPEEVCLVWGIVLQLRVVITMKVVAETVAKVLHKSPSPGSPRKNRCQNSDRERLVKYLNKALNALDRHEHAVPAGAPNAKTNNALNVVRKNIHDALELVQPGAGKDPSKSSRRQKAEVTTDEKTVPDLSSSNGPNRKPQAFSSGCETKGANENGRKRQLPAPSATSENCDELVNCAK